MRQFRGNTIDGAPGLTVGTHRGPDACTASPDRRRVVPPADIRPVLSSCLPARSWPVL